MPTTRLDPLTGSGRSAQAARILDDEEVDRLVAQAEGNDEDGEGEDEGAKDKGEDEGDEA